MEGQTDGGNREKGKWRDGTAGSVTSSVAVQVLQLPGVPSPGPTEAPLPTSPFRMRKAKCKKDVPRQEQEQVRRVQVLRGSSECARICQAQGPHVAGPMIEHVGASPCRTEWQRQGELGW